MRHTNVCTSTYGWSPLFHSHVLYWTQTKEQNMGEAWGQATCTYDSERDLNYWSGKVACHAPSRKGSGNCWALSLLPDPPRRKASLVNSFVARGYNVIGWCGNYPTRTELPYCTLVTTLSPQREGRGGEERLVTSTGKCVNFHRFAPAVPITLPNGTSCTCDILFIQQKIVKLKIEFIS